MVGLLANILRGIKQKVVGDGGTSLIPETPLWNQFSRIGGNMTPADISMILRDADLGRPRRLVDLVHECRQKDGHMQAVLGLRELAVAGLAWAVEPPENASPDEKEAAKACAEAIKTCENFHVLIAHMIGEGCLFPTGAWAELIWGMKLINGKPTEAPILAKPINSRRFGFRKADGRLVFIPGSSDNPEDGYDLYERYEPGNFISYLPRINGDARPREGLARVFAWMAPLRNWDIRDWLLCGELSWKPWRIATYRGGINSEDRDFASEMIETLTTTGAAVKPESVDLNVEWPKSTGSNYQTVHNELAEFFGMEMSKAAIGQTLTVEATVRGARALGQIHDAVRKDIRELDAVGSASSLNRHLVGPFYEFNYPRLRPGSFVWNTEDGVDMEKVAKTINQIAPYVDIPQSWVRDQIGAPEPEEGEPICRVRPEIDDPNADTKKPGTPDTSGTNTEPPEDDADAAA